MTQAYRLSGQTPIVQNILRGFILAAAAIGGFFMLAFSAALAFFVLAGVAIVGFLAFTFFWVRAKLLGRPFGPRAQFEAAQKQFEAQLRSETNVVPGGPIIDAQRTPKGWSVDD